MPPIFRTDRTVEDARSGAVWGFGGNGRVPVGDRHQRRQRPGELGLPYQVDVYEGPEFVTAVEIALGYIRALHILRRHHNIADQWTGIGARSDARTCGPGCPADSWTRGRISCRFYIRTRDA